MLLGFSTSGSDRVRGVAEHLHQTPHLRWVLFSGGLVPRQVVEENGL